MTHAITRNGEVLHKGKGLDIVLEYSRSVKGPHMLLIDKDMEVPTLLCEYSDGASVRVPFEDIHQLRAWILDRVKWGRGKFTTDEEMTDEKIPRRNAKRRRFGR